MDFEPYRDPEPLTQTLLKGEAYVFIFSEQGMLQFYSSTRGWPLYMISKALLYSEAFSPSLPAVYWHCCSAPDESLCLIEQSVLYFVFKATPMQLHGQPPIPFFLLLLLICYAFVASSHILGHPKQWSQQIAPNDRQ